MKKELTLKEKNLLTRKKIKALGEVFCDLRKSFACKESFQKVLRAISTKPFQEFISNTSTNADDIICASICNSMMECIKATEEEKEFDFQPQMNRIIPRIVQVLYKPDGEKNLSYDEIHQEVERKINQ